MPKGTSAKVGVAPTRGRFAIDELRRQSRMQLDHFHVVGVDPGKRELVVAVDQDDRTFTVAKLKRHESEAVTCTDTCPKRHRHVSMNTSVGHTSL